MPPPKADRTAVIVVLVVVAVVAAVGILGALVYLMTPPVNPGGPGKPLVTLSSPTKVNGVTWTFAVAAALPAETPANFKVNFAIGATIGGSAVNLGSTGQNVTVPMSGANPSSVGIKWTDLDGDGALSGGDMFTIAFPSAPVVGTDLTFYLIWTDGSLLQSLTWRG